MDIHIRNAHQEDASFLARSILIAGRAHVKKGIWEVILGLPEEQCLNFLQNIAVTGPPHLFHYSCYFIAETSMKDITGSLGGYSPEMKGYQALQQAIPAVYKKLQLPEKISRDANERAAKIMACLPKEIDNAWVVDSVATMTEYRGNGIAESLLRKVLDEGKKQGHKLSQVNMYIGNEPALHLYQKIGFEIIEEKRDRYFEEKIGSPGMLSLVLQL
jgi:ribosomal protein S18 acetylase RimI-like enzyme